MKILVFDKIYVPGYGMGPFTTPIEVTDARTLASIKLQSRIKVVTDEKPVKKVSKAGEFPIRIVNVKTPEVKEEVIEPEVKEEVIEPEVKEEVIEEVIEPEVKEEVIEEVIEPEVKEEVKAEDFSEWTISELKAKLDEMGVAYLYKDTKTTLIEKIVQNS